MKRLNVPLEPRRGLERARHPSHARLPERARILDEDRIANEEGSHRQTASHRELSSHVRREHVVLLLQRVSHPALPHTQLRLRERCETPLRHADAVKVLHDDARSRKRLRDAGRQAHGETSSAAMADEVDGPHALPELAHDVREVGYLRAVLPARGVLPVEPGVEHKPDEGIPLRKEARPQHPAHERLLRQCVRDARRLPTEEFSIALLLTREAVRASVAPAASDALLRLLAGDDEDGVLRGGARGDVELAEEEVALLCLRVGAREGGVGGVCEF